MVWVYNKTGCLLPFLPRSIGNSSSENQTCFIDADICRARFWSWINFFQVIKDICRRFRFVKTSPWNYNTTRSNCSFYTIRASRTKIVFSHMLWVFFIMRLMRVILLILPILAFMRSLKHSSYSHEMITAMCLLMFFPQGLVIYTSLSILNFGD